LRVRRASGIGRSASRVIGTGSRSLSVPHCASPGVPKLNEQSVTLGRFADKLTSKAWRDIGIATLRYPSLLSPFGGLMLEALLLRLRRWPFAVTYGLWRANYHWSQRSDLLARVGSYLARVALRWITAVLGLLER
jgi:hypothetical protein